MLIKEEIKSVLRDVWWARVLTGFFLILQDLLVPFRVTNADSRIVVSYIFGYTDQWIKI